MKPISRKFIFNILALLILVGIGYFVFTTSNTQSKPDPNVQTYRDEKLGLELSYPKQLKARVEYTYNPASEEAYEDPNISTLPVTENSVVAEVAFTDDSLGNESGIFAKIFYDTGYDTSKVDPKTIENIKARNLPHDTFYKKVGDFLIEYKITYFTFEQKEILYNYAESINITQYHTYDEFDPEIGMSKVSFLCPEIVESTDSESSDKKVRVETLGLEVVYPGGFSFVIDPTEIKTPHLPVAENELLSTFGIAYYYKGFTVAVTYNTQDTQSDNLEQLQQPEFKGFKDDTFNKKTKDFNLAFNYGHAKGYSNSELSADTKEIKVTQYDDYDPQIGMSKKYHQCLEEAYKETFTYKMEKSDQEILEMHLKELKERTQTQGIK